MKNIIITLSFLFHILSVFGQDTIRVKKSEEDQLTTMHAINLVGKWKLDSVQFRQYVKSNFNKQTLLLEETKGDSFKKKVTYYETYEFLKNNTYKYELKSYFRADDVYAQKGKWSCENGMLFLKPNKLKQWSSRYTIGKMTPKKCILLLERDVQLGTEVKGYEEVGYYIRIE